MRRGVGISALNRQAGSSAFYATLSSSLSTQQVTQLQTQLSSFRESLLTFSRAHKDDIRRDPALRHQFQKMCAAIGVDPLATGGSNGKEGKNGWQDLLGLGDWQVELAVQIVDVCVSTRERNGGILAMDELIKRVQRMREGSAEDATTANGFSGKEITPEDITRSIKLLKPLGAGYTIIAPNPSQPNDKYIRSTPSELESDQAILLSLASSPPPGAPHTPLSLPTIGRLNELDLIAHLNWPASRVRQGLENMVKRDGLAWIDEQVDVMELTGDEVQEGGRIQAGMEVWVPGVIRWEEGGM